MLKNFRTRVGCCHRDQPHGSVPLFARPSTIRFIKSRHAQSDTRVGTRMGNQKGDRECDSSPGPFATDMNKQRLSDPAKYQAFVGKMPMGRCGDLHEIAGAAMFLASDASSYVPAQPSSSTEAGHQWKRKDVQWKKTTKTH